MHLLNKIYQIFNRTKKVTPPEPIHGTGDKITLAEGDILIIDNILLEGYVLRNGKKIPYYHAHERGVEHKIMNLGDTFDIKWTFTTIPDPEIDK